MQPIKYLNNWLEKHTNSERYLFSLQDLRALFLDMSDSSFKTLLSRAEDNNYIERICRGLYAYKKANFDRGLLLFHVAAYLRANEFNYISLETILSDAGIISQVPINWISIMSSGRGNIISCGKFGTIEFIHTNQKPANLINNLTYDANCHLWRANVSLALKDIKKTHRKSDLIDWETVNEFI